MGRATSTASLTFYDTGVDASSDMSNINVQAISGTFQMIYDGEETAIMQASASAADMADAIAGISTVGIAPTVTKTFSTGYSVAATDKVDGPHSNADVTHSLSVTWTIEFSAKSGDAKKLTFKYTDTIGTERQASTVMSSTGVALTNTVAGTSGAEYTEFAKNNIVMQYLNQGSTFFDALLTSSAAGTAAAAAASVHDELAADVTVGSTFDVKSSEQFMMYFFDELTAGMPNTNDVDAKMCATWVSANANNLKIVFEYDGEFSTPTDMCVSATSFTTDALLATGLNSLAGVANGLVVVVGQDIRAASTDAAGSNTQPTPSDDSFNKYFPRGLTATGAAHGMITVTLPLGLDGRTFEVTQAYENKVAGMTHFSKANAATLPVGTFDADVDPIGSAMGSLTIAAFPGAGDATKFNPGTYYNVHITKDNSNNGLGKGIYAKVVVSIGAVTHVEITAGGMQVKPSETYSISCDTRIHSLFTDCDGTAADGTRQDVALKDGATTTTLAGTKAGVCAAGTIQRRYSQTGAAAAAGGMLLNVQTLFECLADDAAGAAAAATALTAVTVLAGGAPNGAGTVAKISEIEAVCLLALKDV